MAHGGSSHVDDQIVLMDTLRQLGDSRQENEHLEKELVRLKKDHKDNLEELELSRQKIKESDKLCELYKENRETSRNQIVSLQTQLQAETSKYKKLREEQSRASEKIEEHENTIKDLHRKLEENQAELEEFACLMGVDVDKIGDDGRTPLHRAALNGLEVVAKVLIKAGADVNKANKYGWTPLHWAARNGHDSVVGVLIHAGADANKASNNGRTPLHWAAVMGHDAVAGVLINAGADVNKAGNFIGGTPLHLAALEGHDSAAGVLIHAGALINIRNREGKSPLNLAREKKNKDVVRVLLDAGAQ